MEQQKQQVGTDNKATPGNQAQPKTDDHKDQGKDGNKQASHAGGNQPPLPRDPNASTGASAPKNP